MVFNLNGLMSPGFDGNKAESPVFHVGVWRKDRDDRKAISIKFGECYFIPFVMEKKTLSTKGYVHY